MHLPAPAALRGPGRRAPVFYNAAMCVDRDLGVAFARAWARRVGPGRTGWEMLAATGARGLRLLNESDLFAALTLTELHPDALAVLEANASPWASRGATVRRHDARSPLGERAFEVVDLDPFGSPVPFLDAAFAALAPGGLLAVTATDMMVLAGVLPGACERRYSARPVRGRLAPEAGLRILIADLSRRADVLARHLVPRLAYVHDHHVRVYASIEEGRSATPAPLGAIDPATWDGPTLGGAPPFGPMWLGPLLDPGIIATLEVPATAARRRELETWIGHLKGEAGVDRPFFFEPNEIARALALPHPPSRQDVLDGLRSAGFAAAASHARPGAFRTTAPRSVVYEVARALAR
ncbi:MAG: hypothetical protein ACREDK_01370 [Thermoplasmata archaeon]